MATPGTDSAVKTPTAGQQQDEAIARKRPLAATLSSVLAWSFDLYDLFIILFVASTIGPLLFPPTTPTLELASVYASFAVTLLMRPVGSAIFGAYADRRGRKQAMVIAVFGVGFATALMGAVPTYASAGLLAPACFVLLRLVQGIFVGGVVASTHTLGTETIDGRWRGLVSGLIGGGAGIGAVVASLVFLSCSAVFPGHQFAAWGWRVMFFTGIIGAALSLVVFRRVEESPLWSRMASGESRLRTPIRELFSRRYRAIFALNLLLVAGAATQYYLTSGFLPTFLGKNVHMSTLQAAVVLLAANAVIIVSACLYGHLSQRIGRRKAFLIIGAPNVVLLPVIYLQMATLSSHAVGAVILYTVLLSWLANAAYAPVLVFLNERFPTAIRATGTAVSWNVGFAIGGMMPTFVTLASPAINDLPGRLAIFLIAAVVIYMVGAWTVPETRGDLEAA
jgi:MFS transporter, MHS family, proline/betaine transporter